MRLKLSGARLAAFAVTMFGLVQLGFADRVEGKLEAAVQLKVLNYDRALKSRVKQGKVVIGVVYQAGGDSEKVQKEMVAAFRALGNDLKVQNMTVQAVPVLYRADTFAGDLESAGVNVLYLTPGLDADVSRIRSVAVARQSPTLCSDRALVKQGVELGVFLNKSKTGIAVNVKAAKETGMDLDSALFSVAEVFK